MEHIERLSPNTDPATPGELFHVQTEDHLLTIEVRPQGPYTKGFILSFVESQPPLTQANYYPSEIYVRNNEIIRGEEFELSSMFPLLSKTAFTAMEITPLLADEKVA